MAYVNADAIGETTETTGTGSLTLSGAKQGSRAFSAVMAVGDTCPYSVRGGSDWEAGIATLTATNVLERTVVQSSSNNGNRVSLSSGTKDIYSPLLASVLNGIAGLSYEQGTFTPSVEFSGGAGTFIPTYTAQAGQYTKVGKLVTVNFQVAFDVNNYSGATGGLRIAGLPYVLSLVTGMTGSGLSLSRIANLTFTGQIGAYVDGAGKVSLRRITSAAADAALQSAAIPPSTTGIVIGATGSYLTI